MAQSGMTIVQRNAQIFRADLVAQFAECVQQQPVFADVIRLKDVVIALNDHVYNQVDFIHRLKSYLNTVPLASEMCIYFEDRDFVISSTAKYGLDYFINGLLSYGDDRLADSGESWLDYSVQEEDYTAFQMQNRRACHTAGTGPDAAETAGRLY